MLKLTNSFYKYLVFTCERVNQTHVKRFSHLNCKSKICVAEATNIKLTALYHSSLQLCQHGHSKKRLKIKIPSLNFDKCKRDKKMSDSEQPTFHHASYGGRFDISSDSDDPAEECAKRCQTGQAVSSGQGRSTPLVIPPEFRMWEAVGQSSDSNQCASFKFKVLSYNVLAQYLLECHPYLYTDCSPQNLKWKVRAARLYEEIMTLAPDIICFQEVQVSHLQSFFAKFEQIGYYGVYKQRTGHRLDGCAIYFKESMFELKDHLTVEFYQPNMPILNRDNIGIMVKLMPRGLIGAPVVIATTHLLYNPKRTDVRLAQMRVLLSEIDRFAFFDNERESGLMPIILTGDFNSKPDGPVLQLLDKGNVSVSSLRDCSDWKNIGVMDNCQHLCVFLNRQQGRDTDFSQIKLFNSDYCTDVIETSALSGTSIEHFSQMFNGDVIEHSLKLSSVYKKCKPDGQFEATSYQDRWVTVDYIYYSSCSPLKLIERLRLPTATECKILGHLPNEVYASDHLALAACFEITPYMTRF